MSNFDCQNINFTNAIILSVLKWYPAGSPNGVSPNGVLPNGGLPKEYKHGSSPKRRFAERRFAECGVSPNAAFCLNG
jgi:hypothetical protein